MASNDTPFRSIKLAAVWRSLCAPTRPTEKRARRAARLTKEDTAELPDNGTKGAFTRRNLNYA